jgi:hypothetical protein
MVGLGYILVCLGTIAALLTISLIPAAVTWWSSRHRRA